MNSLEKYRSNREAWCDLAYLESPLPDDEVEDANAKQRSAILVELQYGLGPGDQELVRYMFEQEMMVRKNDAQGGLDEAFKLNAYLLARYQDPADIPLFHRAKRIDFDAWAGGFDEEFMYWALKAETHAFIASHFPEIHEEYKDTIHPSEYYETYLNRWWASLEDWYPSSLADESLYTLYLRSFYFGNIDQARMYLKEWETEQSKRQQTNDSLEYAYEKLGDYPKVIEILQGKLAQVEKRGWDRASVLSRLLEIYVCAERYAEGFQCLKLIDEEFRLFEDWKQTGLGRNTVGIAFQYVASCEDDGLAAESFLLVDAWAQNIKSLPWGKLEAGNKAATRCNLPMQAERYHRLMVAERARSKASLG